MGKRGKEVGEKKEETNLLENLLAAIFTTNSMLDNCIILTEVLVETGDAVEGEADTDEVYYIVQEGTGVVLACGENNTCLKINRRRYEKD